MRRIPCLLPVLFLTAACAASDPAAEGPVMERRAVDPSSTGQVMALHQDVRGGVSVLPHAADSLWAVLPDVYRQVGIEPAHFDPAARSVGNLSFAASRELGGTSLSKLVRCGMTSLGLPRENSSRINFSVQTTLSPAGDAQTRVQTRVTAFTRSGSAGSAECVSTGALETLISRSLEERVAG